MNRSFCALAFAFPFLLSLGLLSRAADAPPNFTYEEQIRPLLRKYCYECHGNGKEKGGVALDTFKDLAAVKEGAKTWESVLEVVRSHEMPDEDAENQPTDAERTALTSWIERELFQFDPAHPDPGRVVLRRLNRAEYSTTIRDLIGVDFKASAEFPPDDSGYGFDNIGDVLSLPPVLLEKYLAAADKILDQAIVTDPIKSEVRHVPAALAQVGFNAIGDRGDGWVQLISLEEDDAAVDLTVPAGDYLVRVFAFAKRVGGALRGQGSEAPLEFKEDPGPTKIAVMLNDAFVKDFEVTNDERHPQVYEARVGVPAGHQSFRAVVRRERGGANELLMLNGRLGKQQPGIVLVKWMEIEGPLAAATTRVRAKELVTDGDTKLASTDERLLAHAGAVATEFKLEHPSEVILRAQAYAHQAGDEPARMDFRVDGKTLKTFEVLAPATMNPLPGQRLFSITLLKAAPQVYEVRTHLPAGSHQFAAAFVNAFADPQNTNSNLRERSLVVQNLEVANLSEPAVIPVYPEPLAKLFAQRAPADESTNAARTILAQFTRRAWRRPLEMGELDRLEKLYGFARANGDSFEGGVKLAMKAALVSPHFLFVGETLPPKTMPSIDPRPLGEFALASRLSYFLWSSLPDDELLALAEHGVLRENLKAQVKRMSASPKARALVDNFAGQWLQIRSLETIQPDKLLFPEFDPALRNAMQRETELFFEYIMRDDRSVIEFLSGDYTFVNGRLAKFYGLSSAFKGDDFQKVSLAGTPRRGVLTQAAVLALTSNPTRTSPVKRGKWVLENLLGTPPPPPPPNVPDLDDKERKLAGTLRHQMEQHRSNPACASCHARMDPIGFGLENFNAIGAWRDKDSESPVDSSGKLASGETFAGAVDLANVLAKKRRAEFLHCVAEKMLTYALGRGTVYADRPALDQIVKQMETNEDRFSSLILAVAESFPFQMRRGDAPPLSTVAAR